jgi:hypothetical protein
MAVFLDTLPDPTFKMGIAGDDDASGTPGPGFASVKLKSVQPMISTDVNSRRHEKDTSFYHKWEIAITYNPLTCLQFHPVYTFLALKKNTLEPFYVSLPQYSGQLTTEKVSLSGYTYPKGFDAIDVEDVDTAPVTTQPGQLFTIGSNEKVYMTTRVETPSDFVLTLAGGSDERLYFTPSLLEDITDTSLYFLNRKIKVRQVGNTVEYALKSNNLFQFSLRLEEVIDG